MSAGPIKAARDAWVPPKVSTTAKGRVCASGLDATSGRSYCGRTSSPRVDAWSKVTCADCHAAHRADVAAVNA